MVMDRMRTIEVALEGLARLGLPLPATPRPLQPLAAMRLNQRKLRRLTIEDHVNRPAATDPRALAALQLLSHMLAAAQYTQRIGLYLLVSETAIALVLKYGHIPRAAGWFAMHACFSHAMFGDYAAARETYEVCDALDVTRPAPEVSGRIYVVLHYMVGPWFAPLRYSAIKLASAIQRSAEAGDMAIAALCASASTTMLSLLGTPLDRVVATIEGWGSLLRGDGGVAANAANLVNIAGKLSRGEPLVQDDLDRVSNVPAAAGPMRFNAMVNLGLAIMVAGHEAQVRAWLDEIRDVFLKVNFGAPHLVTLRLLDGLFAARDARTGTPGRRADAERILEQFRKLRRDTRSTSNDAAIALLEAELARGEGDLDRAVGLFSRAVREARAREHMPLVAYANEQWAAMLEDAGYPDDARPLYREAVAAYRRWAHLTKVIALEQAHPGAPGARRRRGPTTAGGVTSTGKLASTSAGDGGTVSATVNDRLDLMTVLQVSQDISVQLTPAGVVRAVLTGIAQNAGAESVILVLRDGNAVERVYGEIHNGTYREPRHRARRLPDAGALGAPGGAADRSPARRRRRDQRPRAHGRSVRAAKRSRSIAYSDPAQRRGGRARDAGATGWWPARSRRSWSA